MQLIFDDNKLSLATVSDLSFQRKSFTLSFSASCLTRVEQSQKHLLNYIEKNHPIYGVTTGFGDSCHRVIDKTHVGTLQQNLISYLRCGSGRTFNPEVTRAALLVRIKSLSRGYSGVSKELLMALSAM